MAEDKSSLKKEELRLFAEYKKNPSPKMEELLMKRFEKLVYSIMKDFGSSPADIEDIRQVGMTGLLLAIRRYDPASNYRFSTFAWPTIRGEIQRFFRDKRWMVKVPRRLKEISQKVFSAQALIAAKIGQEPTAKEISEETGLTEEVVLEAMELGSAYSPKAFFDNIDDDDYGHYVTSSQVVDSSADDVQQSVFWEAMFRHLKKVEAEVLRLRFFEGMTQKEVAEILETSQMCISRIQRIALAKLREMAEQGEIDLL
ncbi:sigma-70 family RNA polymerase sigma factor [bacterium]|nr:sigma-70 family RNA polymerase sigma factor [bacterium]